MDVITQGIGQVADSYARPTDSFRPAVEGAIVQYPYDPNRALQLMAEGGWTRGTDGILVHQASGERFQSKIAARPTSGADAACAGFPKT